MAEPIEVRWGVMWDDLGTAETFPTREQAVATALSYEVPGSVIRIETYREEAS